MAPKNNGGNNGGMVAQEHGGALKSGGTPGNKGGTGRPPSAIREHCRGSFAERVKVLETIADGEVIEKMLVEGSDGEIEVMKSARVTDRLKAIELLAKYGGVDKLALTADEQPVAGELTPKRIAEWWEQIGRIKTIKGFEKMLTDAAKDQAAANGG